MSCTQEQIRERTSQYIVCHLDPYLWSMEPTWNEVSDLDGVDEADVAHAILALSYDDFLQTPYWQAIASRVKRRAGGECEFCGQRSDLTAHHITYAHHGWEHRHLDDIRCACGACHDECHRRQGDLTT